MHRTFSFLRAEPISFSVDDKEEYRCQSQCAAGYLLDLAQSMSGKVSVDEQAMAFQTFMQAVVLPEDWPAFEARLRDASRPITLPMIVDIATWLLEAYTQRPLEMPSSSPNGASETGPTSTGASRSKGKTRSTSTPVVSSTPSV